MRNVAILFLLAVRGLLLLTRQWVDAFVTAPVTCAAGNAIPAELIRTRLLLLRRLVRWRLLRFGLLVHLHLLPQILRL